MPTTALLRLFARSPLAVAAATIVLLLLITAVIGPSLVPQNPYNLAELGLGDNLMPPGTKAEAGFTFLLGADAQGRDMLSTMVYGLRTSLAVGVSACLIAVSLGTVLGLTAGYFGGRTETLIMRFVDFMLSFPTILVALMIMAFLGQGVAKLIFALILVQWAYFARVVRGAALVERSKDYIEAARCLRLGPVRIILRHLLPNCLPPVIVVGTLQIASAIATEATLSFLGIGLPITEPSLGLLIANGYEHLLTGKYWVAVFPGLLLLVLIFSINIAGDRLREILNPRLQGR
ncbi:ABC transporter permease [Elstera cyanobacteriorum]|uniref:Peptide ABC transporter permease n=1 Tax=Elstera cyanobacteriorum TaxID=2022747 RepID=A0A255XWW4_9PROT|nr:ABC transporter permease [Elstera cyanobacteriorum]MCK6443649.1 ABC transporter permease [Elstera cyanobacteriorum]OYQ21423.1 peptide ABC transporter permease [Elstera cyanobacteriorum]GFZ96964.1 peptide ABC transporter permease [Elstera cyanobacteriorum]